MAPTPKARPSSIESYAAASASSQNFRHALSEWRPAGSAHHWAREIAAFGHSVRLIPAQYVKPFVKRGETDAADAEAISEAVTRKTMRFVPIKSAEQQASVMVFRTRALLVRQRTQAINALRAHMGELGIIATTGIANIKPLAAIVRDESDARLPPAARFALEEIVDQIDRLAARIEKLEREIIVVAKCRFAFNRKIPD